MRKLYYLAAGLAAVALVAALAASTKLGSDCKTAWGNQACPPARAAAVQTAEMPPAPPKPQPDLQKTKSTAPKPAVARKTAKPKRPAVPRPAAVGSLGPRPYAGAPTHREYYDRLERYAAQDPDYGRYGDAPDKDDRAREDTVRGDAPDANAVRMPATFDDRARLDPWHGYDDRDGLENGY